MTDEKIDKNGKINLCMIHNESEKNKLNTPVQTDK